MSSLRDEVIQQIFDECADFPERSGISEDDACLFATTIGGWLRERWPENPTFFPRFEEVGSGHVQVWAQELYQWPMAPPLSVRRG